jgi:iron complex transport system substrate-binding protein
MRPRIISLVPSLSETICALGGQQQIVGCTSFCVRPANLHRTAALVGGTKDPNIEQIRKLGADLVLVNEEENRIEDVRQIELFSKVHNTFPRSPRDVPSMLKKLGAVVKLERAADITADKIQRQIDEIDLLPKIEQSFAYLIWKEPLMVVSSDTYISKVLEMRGLRNVYETSSIRYPVSNFENLQSLNPDIVFLSTEPYSFRRRDAIFLRKACPDLNRIYKIDGQLFSWYGTYTSQCLNDLRIWRTEELSGCKNY